jgi:hypothetical protein
VWNTWYNSERFNCSLPNVRHPRCACAAIDQLLPSSFAPAKRKRQARTDDNVTSLDKYLSNLVMWKEPSSKRARPAAPAQAALKEVVSVIFVVGTRESDAGEAQQYVMAKLIARPPVRGSYVKLVLSEKKLAVELLQLCCCLGAAYAYSDAKEASSTWS